MSVNVEKCNFGNSPCCPHGPTVLFSRNSPNKRKFYACSACRDRKDCSFFLYKDELTKFNDEPWDIERKKYVRVNRQVKMQILKQIKDLDASMRVYCICCDRFILPKFVRKHDTHQLIKNISNEKLSRPSNLLSPLDNAKKEAQYLFSNPTVKTIVVILEDVNVCNVLCVGSPRIHEYLLNEKPNMNSLLLDFDKRYHNFYDITKFCWYNMFNHHFFLPKSRSIFKNFLKRSGEFVLISDPPFGCRVELLAKTFNRINKLYKTLTESKDDLKIMLVFPYFMEPQILNSLPNFQMLDYKVDYDNHALFCDGPKGRKQGSPVRIFTNIDLSTITLPTEQGYRYCQICTKYVSLENAHCKKCNSCTSKDGRTYAHCDFCQKCVKPTWKHCTKCNRCALVQHKCGEITFDQKCFHCNKSGHKKRECPDVDHESLRQKRRKTS